MEGSVMSPRPGAEDERRRQVLREFAQTHDMLDSYRVPRTRLQHANQPNGPMVAIDLPGRLELFVSRLRDQLEPQPWQPIRVDGGHEERVA